MLRRFVFAASEPGQAAAAAAAATTTSRRYLALARRLALGLQLFLAQRDRSFRYDRLWGTCTPTATSQTVQTPISRECVSARWRSSEIPRGCRRTVGHIHMRVLHESLIVNDLRALGTNKVIYNWGDNAHVTVCGRREIGQSATHSKEYTSQTIIRIPNHL